MNDFSVILIDNIQECSIITLVEVRQQTDFSVITLTSEIKEIRHSYVINQTFCQGAIHTNGICLDVGCYDKALSRWRSVTLHSCVDGCFRDFLFSIYDNFPESLFAMICIYVLHHHGVWNHRQCNCLFNQLFGELLRKHQVFSLLAVCEESIQ